MSNVQTRIIAQLATELGAAAQQIQMAVQLLDEGATVPFIARYRKEVTGGLDDALLRDLQERLTYLRELEDRRSAILESIEGQGKLTNELKTAIETADTKQTLEDLYLPYKPKRRTRAQIAREAGLQPLADLILEQTNCNPEQEAQAFLNPEHNIADTKAALEGARDILAEQFSENATLLATLRQRLQDEGCICAQVVPEKEKDPEAARFRDYFNHQEPLGRMASHRMLAMLRGREQGFLTLKVDLPEFLALENARAAHPFEAVVAACNQLRLNDSPRGLFLADTCRWTWRVKLATSMETGMITQLREQAQTEAINVFGKNLKDLLLAAPAGGKATMGLDPGIRTGVKVAVVDATGKVLETSTVYPHEPRRQWDESMAALAALCARHQVGLIAIGNGTASRETDQLVAEMLTRFKNLTENFNTTRVMVSEAGASVYSASALASSELPELDVSLRGAVSIARRLQDPLAELVKIDPKSIGVGQYQHDVDQRQLSSRLDAVVEDCVNAVGVELNTASEALLTKVSGLNGTVAKSIVNWRNQNGRFHSREDLKKVPRLGDKTFEQAAGFLRIHAADNPLDASAVHPEAYGVVKRMATQNGLAVEKLIANSEILNTLKPEAFADERFGLPTIRDILKELDKPGRDPRPEFKTARFDDKVHTLQDLKPGMTLEGVITNVANFGAFVDIGVHQDGLVHVSALSNTFVKDPHTVVKTGQVVKVKVLEVDIPRKRVSLTMRLTDEVHSHTGREGNNARGVTSRSDHTHGERSTERHKERQVEGRKDSSSSGRRAGVGGSSQNFANNALAAAFAKAKKN